MGSVRTIPLDRPEVFSHCRCRSPVRRFSKVTTMVSRATGRKERVWAAICHWPLSPCTS